MIWYIYILAYFVLLETVVVYTINTGFKKLEKRKLVNLYLLVRVAKIMLSLTFLGVYYFVVKPADIKTFALVFAMFYLVSIGFETWYFIGRERQLKRKEKEEKEE